jgi:hypothetical protein
LIPAISDHRSAPRALAAAAAALLLTAAAPAEETFETRLASAPMDIMTRESLAGVGRAYATLNGATLTVTGRFEGMPTPAVGANLHQGVAIAARGPVIAKLAVSAAASGTISGTVRLSAAQVAALRASRMYVQINSVNTPDGHLWGWLQPPRTIETR